MAETVPGFVRGGPSIMDEARAQPTGPGRESKSYAKFIPYGGLDDNTRLQQYKTGPKEGRHGEFIRDRYYQVRSSDGTLNGVEGYEVVIYYMAGSP